MKLNYLTGFLALALITASCSKSSDSGSNNGGGNNINTYQPNGGGSYWKYANKDTSGNTLDTFTLTSTGRDTTIKGDSYRIFNSSSKANSAYTGTQYQ